MRESSNTDLDTSLVSNSDIDFSSENLLQSAYKEIKLNLKNINITIKKGQCVALIGKVGSGKSSFLSCLSGEMYSQQGT
jgi:ABC-type transport system involved in cytochrome bd biosynthesis fused ATPase/permease subunit